MCSNRFKITSSITNSSQAKNRSVPSSSTKKVCVLQYLAVPLVQGALGEPASCGNSGVDKKSVANILGEPFLDHLGAVDIAGSSSPFSRLFLC